MQGARKVRYTIYGAGNLLLAVGITLNTKAGLGVSPVISIPYGIARIGGYNLGFVTFWVYTLFVGAQLLLQRPARPGAILAQMPFSLAFSLCLNLCGGVYDRLWGGPATALPQQLLALVLGIILTAAGVSLMVDMEGVPNPADGLAKALGEAFHKGMGFGKNVLDFGCVLVTCLLGLLLSGRVVGVGLGTLAAVVGVGRCIAAFQRLFRKRLCRAAGLLQSVPH